jgi:RHS repeat-associated protein
MTGNGGAFSPVAWPLSDPNPDVRTYTVYVNREAKVFHRTAPADRIPSATTVNGWITDFHVDCGESLAAQEELVGTPTLAIRNVYPNSDGTEHYVETLYSYSVMGPNGKKLTFQVKRKILFLGELAIWTDGGTEGLKTWVSTRWNDLVSISPATGSHPRAPLGWIIQDERSSPRNQITLTVQGLTDGPAAYLDALATLKVTNTLGLPKAEMTGRYSDSPLIASEPVLYPVNESIWAATFKPDSMVVTAGSESISTAITWMEHPPFSFPYTITHPNGMVEKFTWGTVPNLNANSYSNKNVWIGYWPYPHLSGIDPNESAENSEANADSNRFGVKRITIPSGTGGAGRTIEIVRVIPRYSKPLARPYYWVSPEHRTTVLTFPFEVPESTVHPDGQYRALRLIHPSADSWTTNTDPQAYLFATSTVLSEEQLVGTAVDAVGEPSGATSVSIQIHDGWDLRSWVNPTASMDFGANPIALRTTTHQKDVATKISVAGFDATGRDDRGPVKTDEVTQAPPTQWPTVSGATPSAWYTSLTALTGDNHRTGTVVRGWVAVRGKLETNTDEKRLDSVGGNSLNRFKFGSVAPSLVGVPSVNFGTTSWTYDSFGRVLTQVGDRGTAKATETRAYDTTHPNATLVTKALLRNQTNVLANPDPDNPSVPPAGETAGQVGKSYTYDNTNFHWLTGETDLTDGRTIVITPDPMLGREKRRVDVYGHATDTTYDDWGRIQKVTTDGGTARQRIVEFTYDPAGLFKIEKVTADLKSLTTRTDFDMWGNVVLVTFPDGSTQSSQYDGWGQKIKESLPQKPNINWGLATFEYDSQGRLTRSLDVNGKVLSEVILQDTYRPAQVVNGVSIPAGVWKTVKDYGLSDATTVVSYPRTTVTDLLGQKVAIIDQANQVTLFWYDQDGHLIKTDQGGVLRWYEYDDAGWLLRRFEPEEGITLFGSHNLLGTPTKVTNFGRQGGGSWVTKTAMNASLQPKKITSTGPEGTVTKQLTYRTTDKLLDSLTETQANGSISESYDYDDLQRLNFKSVSDGSPGLALSRTMDTFGNVLTEVLPAAGGRVGQTISRTYDNLNRPTVVQIASATRGTMTYPAPIAGQNEDKTLLTYGNGVSTTTTVQYGRIVKTEHAVVNAGGILKDPATGALVQLESNAITWTVGGLMKSRGRDTFSYDSLRRLSNARVDGVNPNEVITQSYGYDRWGHRNSSTYSYVGPSKPTELISWSYISTGSTDIPNSLTIPGGSVATNVTYDALGRITAVDAVPGVVTERMQWGYDAQNRVVRETQNGTLSTFLLDGEGLRFKRTTGTTSTITLYGFGREPMMVFQKTTPGSLTWQKTLVHGFGTLLSEEKTAGPTYIQGDYVGSPNLMTDSTGTVVGRTKNLPFGERLNALGTVKSHRRYTNHEDQAGSPIYMQARTYLPVFGKFAQVDPVYDQAKDDPESWNLYNYATNNPVTNTDPDGRATVTGVNPNTGERSTDELTDEELQELREKGRITKNGKTYILKGGDGKSQEGQSPDPNAGQSASGPQGYGMGSGPWNPAAEEIKKAIKNGEILKVKIGKVEFTFFGGSMKERLASYSALMKIFTASQHGATMLKALESRKTWFGLGRVKSVEIVLSDWMGSGSVPGSQQILLGTYQIGGSYHSLVPGGKISFERVLAHELGHAAMGSSDDPPNTMENVSKHENRVMRELGDFNDRIRYSNY